MIILGPRQLVGQVLLLHPMARKVVGIEIALVPLHTGGVGVDVLQVPGDVPRPAPRMSAWAAAIPRYTELDLGAVASSTAAWARGSRASGRPNCNALSTQAFTMGTAMG